MPPAMPSSAIARTSAVTSLQGKGKNCKYTLPKEGTPTWIDYAGISKQGNRPIVYKFINDNLVQPMAGPLHQDVDQ